MTTKLSQVFQITEAPTDWKKSFKKARKVLHKHGDTLPAGSARGLEVPKSAKPPDTEPSQARANPAGGDPQKVSTNAEVFEAPEGEGNGTYVVLKVKLGSGNPATGRYLLLHVKDDGEVDSTDHGTRREAIDAMLHAHDKSSAGIGEGVDEDDEVDVHAKNVHIDLSPHEHDDVYEGNHVPAGSRLTDVFVRPGARVLGNGRK